MSIKLLPGAEPFFIPGGKIGCLCVHGLTASPQEVYWLGAHLAAQGATVYGPRLFGHGTTIADLKRVRWQHWYNDVLNGYYLLRAHCDEVFALGISTGGMLCLELAAHEEIAGVVGMATAFRVKPRSRLAHILRYFGSLTPKEDRAADPLNQRIEQLQRARGERVTGRVAYYQLPAAGVSELLKLQNVVERNLARITAPVLLIQSEKDQTVLPVSAELLEKGLIASRDVQRLMLKESGHILTNDIEYPTVFAAAWAFIERCAVSVAVK